MWSMCGLLPNLYFQSWPVLWDPAVHNQIPCLAFPLWWIKGILYLTLNFTHKLLPPLALLTHCSLHHLNTGVFLDYFSWIHLNLNQTQVLSAPPFQYIPSSTVSLYLRGEKSDTNIWRLISCNAVMTSQPKSLLPFVSLWFFPHTGVRVI